MANFKGANGLYWEVDTEQLVQIYPAGGGFVLKVPLSLVLAMTEALPEDYIPGRFVIADGDTIFEGYYREDMRWNGWMMPQLTFASAMQLVEKARLWGDASLRYDAEQDAFIYSCGDCPDEDEVYSAFILEVEGKEVKTYGVGAGSWVWDKHSPEPEGEADVAAP